MTIDRDWVRAQVAFYFGQMTSMVHKEGTTQAEILDLVDELTDKIMAKVSDEDK